MGKILARFPDVGEKILDQIDDKSLVLCRGVSKIWKNFTEQQKIIWIRKIEKYIGQRSTFSDDWKKVVFKNRVDIIRNLATSLEEFYESPNKLYKVHSPLFIAVKQGNVQLTQHLIRRVKCINWKDSFGATPFYVAAENGNLELCRLIIPNIEDKNPAKYDGETPLHIAAQNGHLEICQLIVTNVEDKNPTGYDGWTPLDIAAKKWARGNLQAYYWKYCGQESQRLSRIYSSIHSC